MSTTLCPFCRKLVPTQIIHTCWDADAVERRRLAEQRVLDAAIAYRRALLADTDPWGLDVDPAHDALLDAVETLEGTS